MMQLIRRRFVPCRQARQAAFLFGLLPLLMCETPMLLADDPSDAEKGKREHMANGKMVFNALQRSGGGWSPRIHLKIK